MTAYEPKALREQVKSLVRLALINKGLAERYGLDCITLDIAKKVAKATWTS
jgi:hypothetical protein